MYAAVTYRVGKDCSAGEYKLTASDHSYFCVCPDISKGGILENSNFDIYEYITVSDGQCLVVEHDSFVAKGDATPAKGSLAERVDA